MSIETDLEQLRRGRNWFGACAIALAVLSLAVALPRKLAQHRELKGLNDEIVSLQKAIGVNNAQIRETQLAINQAQQEISRMLHP